MERRGRTPLLAAISFASAALVMAADERPAAAEEPSELETADGTDECRAFVKKNTKELLAWEKEQPPVPYAYPREKTFLYAPWAQFFGSLGHAGELVLATVIPHVGAQFRGDAPAATVSWPWQAVFGPMYSCSRKRGTFVVHGHRAHRAILEPAVVSSTRGVGFSVRPGYRFVWHPSSWVVGPGLGLGSTFEVAGNQEPFRFSISPEALAHFGTCCRSSYFTFAVRYDRFFKGTNLDILGASLGYTFF